jgi:hypothetical protein
MTIMRLPGVSDERGNLRWIEGGNTIPFEIKRVFYITEVPRGSLRGGHAHRKCHQFIVLVKGELSCTIDHGDGHETSFTMRSGDSGIHVPPMTWCSLFMDPDTVCLVLASERYDESDYIRQYDLFLEEVGK